MTDREIVKREIEPSLLHLLHQTKLHLEELLPGEQTSCMLYIVAKSKRSRRCCQWLLKVFDLMIC